MGYWASVSSMEGHRALACLNRPLFIMFFDDDKKNEIFVHLGLVMLVATTKCFKFALLLSASPAGARSDSALTYRNGGGGFPWFVRAVTLK